MRNPKNLCAR